MGRKLKSLEGRRFGRWVVLERNLLINDPSPYWICLCDCGTYGDIRGSSLVQNQSKSCGCLQKELQSVRQKATSIGNPARKRGTLAYFKCNTWNNIRKRVINGKPDIRNQSYIRKGIMLKMTKEEFYSWCDSVWEIASKLRKPSIDRIDNEGHYELNNIQVIEHADNVRKSHK